MPLSYGAKLAMKAAIRTNFIAKNPSRYQYLNAHSEDFDNLCSAIVDSLIDGIILNASVTIPSVTLVTPGTGISGPGINGTIS